MKNIFNSVKVVTPKYNVFNLSHSKRFTANMSDLNPVMCQEVLPGETWSVSTQGFVRMLPLVTPVMHHIDVKIWYFFVPNRLLWDNWREFITYGVNGPTDQTLAPQHAKPYVSMTGLYLSSDDAKSCACDGSLMDFLGFPTIKDVATWNAMPHPQTAGVERVDIMPFVAYHLIWNDYFCNRNVETNLDDNIKWIRDKDGKLVFGTYSWLFYKHKINWNLDYYTSCLPFLQRGVAAPLPFNADIQNTITYKDQGEVLDGTSIDNGMLGNEDNTDNLVLRNLDTGEIQPSNIRNIEKITSKMTGITATINDLRFATRLQSWLEKSARVGSRYIEQVKAHFGVTSSDARMQRAELLGGGSFPIMISDIEQTSETQQTPLGTLGGKGTGFGQTKGFRKHFEEHGWLFGLMAISPRAVYKNNFPRQYMRFNPLDYYFPEFQHLGEQAVTKYEVSPDLTGDADKYNKETFGYQQRFAEYRYIPSTVHGGFKNGEDLSKWVMCRDLGQVALNQDFVQQQVDYNNFADTTSDSDHFLIELFHNVKAARPMDVYATPTL